MEKYYRGDARTGIDALIKMDTYTSVLCNNIPQKQGSIATHYGFTNQVKKLEEEAKELAAEAGKVDIYNGKLFEDKTPSTEAAKWAWMNRLGSEMGDVVNLIQQLIYLEPPLLGIILADINYKTAREYARIGDKESYLVKQPEKG